MAPFLSISSGPVRSPFQRIAPISTIYASTLATLSKKKRTPATGGKWEQAGAQRVRGKQN